MAQEITSNKIQIQNPFLWNKIKRLFKKKTSYTWSVFFLLTLYFDRNRWYILPKKMLFMTAINLLLFASHQFDSFDLQRQIGIQVPNLVVSVLWLIILMKRLRSLSVQVDATVATNGKDPWPQ